MASVTFPPAVGGDGSTVTDDSNVTTGLGNGGHRTRFVPALAQVVAVADNTVTKATEAAASAAEALGYRNDAQVAATSAAENAVLGKYTFSNNTSMGDPGVGVFRLNNASTASTTAIAVDAQTSDAGNPNTLNYLLTWDDSTSSVKGQLRIAKAATPTIFAIFNVSALTNNTGWVQLSVTYVAGAGTFTNNDISYFEFFRNGDAGAGDVTLNGVQTLTNKTINASNNTITNVSLSTGVTGTLPVSNGGTGTTSLTANSVLLGNGTSALQTVAPGTSGNVLTSNGSAWVSSAPSSVGTGTGAYSTPTRALNTNYTNTDTTTRGVVVSVSAAAGSGSWAATGVVGGTAITHHSAMRDAVLTVYATLIFPVPPGSVYRVEPGGVAAIYLWKEYQ